MPSPRKRMIIAQQAEAEALAKLAEEAKKKPVKKPKKSKSK